METVGSKSHALRPVGDHDGAGRDEFREVSIYAVANVLLRHFRTIVAVAIIVAVVAAARAALRDPIYRASASFMPQDNSANGVQGLAALVGQRVQVSSAQSPDFYVVLLRSRELLSRIVRDTFVVAEHDGRRENFVDLFHIAGATEQEREEHGVTALRSMTSAASDKITGMVTLSAASKWPSVSLALANAMIVGINEFNQRTRQSQASAERKFVEAQLSTANAELQAAEDDLESFLTSNKAYDNSPQLALRQDRLRRRVVQKQAVANSLTTAFEDAKIRQIRDTPVISIVESAVMPVTPEARGRLKSVLLGAVVGVVLATILIFVAEVTRHARISDDPDAREFFKLMANLPKRLIRWIPARRVSGVD